MRMNISVPDELALEVRRFGIPISEVAQAALRQAVAESRGARIARLREGLAEEASYTADTRRNVAEDYPDDTRNVQCARTLEGLAKYVRGLPDDDLRLGTLLNLDANRGDDYYTVTWRGERWNHAIYRLGFHGRGVLLPRQALDELMDAATEDAGEFEEEFGKNASGAETRDDPEAGQ